MSIKRDSINWSDEPYQLLICWRGIVLTVCADLQDPNEPLLYVEGNTGFDPQKSGSDGQFTLFLRK